MATNTQNTSVQAYDSIMCENFCFGFIDFNFAKPLLKN